MPESGPFAGVGYFTRTQDKHPELPATGKEREVWITQMKQALYSSGLAKGSWANKTLTFLMGDALRLFEDKSPKYMQREGRESGIFDELVKQFPDKPKTGHKTEKLQNLVTFRPARGEATSLAMKRFKTCVKEGKANGINMTDNAFEIFLLAACRFRPSDESNVLSQTGGKYDFEPIITAIQMLLSKVFSPPDPHSKFLAMVQTMAGTFGVEITTKDVLVTEEKELVVPVAA